MLSDGAAALPKPNSASASKNPGSLVLRTGASLGRRRLAADRVSVSQQLQRVGRGRIEIVGGDEIFAKVDVLSFKVRLHQMSGVLVDLQRERFGRRLKIADRVRGMQFEINAQMGAACAWYASGRNGIAKYDLRFSTGNRLVILDLQPLRTPTPELA